MAGCSLHAEAFLLVSPTICPSRNVMIRSRTCATSSECVTTTMVIPCVRLRFWKMPMISALVRESSCAGGFVGQEDFAVRSPARGQWQPFAAVRRKAASGDCARARQDRPRPGRAWPVHRRLEYRRCCRAGAARTFSSALMRGRRLKFWKTKPIFWFRISASWSRSRLSTGTPSSR